MSRFRQFTVASLVALLIISTGIVVGPALVLARQRPGQQRHEARAYSGRTTLALAQQEPGQQQYDASTYSGLRWRMLGPFRGGRVNAVTGVPGQPSTFYFGSVNGGVWKTADSGGTWTPITDGQNIASIGALAVAPRWRVGWQGVAGHGPVEQVSEDGRVFGAERHQHARLRQG